MFIITILTVDTNEITVHEVYNDEIVAQNELIKCATIQAINVGKNDIVFRSTNEILVYHYNAGYITTSKELWKIIRLHNIPKYTACDLQEEDLSE